MLTTKTRNVDKRSQLSLMACAWLFCLTLGVGTAAAEEHPEDTEVMAERPVVVVRSAAHHPNLTWAFVGGRAFLGVQTIDLTPELREHFGVPRQAGVLVAKIVEDSPAAESDLEVGDIITAVEGEEIVSASDLARAVGHRESGEVVDLEVWRQGTVRSLSSTLVERQGPSVDIRQFHLPEGRLEHWEWDDRELDGAIELETETLNRAIERLNAELDSPEWEQRAHEYREHQGALMKRIEVLEERLKELEKELEGLAKGE